MVIGFLLFPTNNAKAKRLLPTQKPKKRHRPQHRECVCLYRYSLLFFLFFSESALLFAFVFVYSQPGVQNRPQTEVSIDGKVRIRPFGFAYEIAISTVFVVKVRYRVFGT
jgi:hypothetical protein